MNRTNDRNRIRNILIRLEDCTKHKLVDISAVDDSDKKTADQFSRLLDYTLWQELLKTDENH
ncbi:MAG: hypothetical protein IMZ64_05105 [Bacteroidetes bacterium]|nr:hypothetical protein [Bacteroidota bacterium]